MRIIAGAAKGRTLRAPKGSKTRPMMDRAKEAIFSALAAKVEDAAVLDLYAGTGSLGLEALSRGARSAMFVEWRREAVRALMTNIAAVGLGGEAISAKVEGFLGREAGTFDLAFVDPPYEMPLPSVEAVLGQLVRLLADNATVVVHRRSGSGEISEVPGLALSDRRRYGDAEITRLTKEAKA